MQTPVAIHPWPAGLPQALADLRGSTGLTVISVPTEQTGSRPQARKAIRHALQGTVAAWLGQPLSAVTLLSSPGQPVRVQAPGAPVWVAISHMSGLSVAAICSRGAVGVDVMNSPPPHLPDWAGVARDYLGPRITDALHRTPPADRPAAFAQAWTELEARLKYASFGLAEWSPARDQCLATCQLWPLLMPSGGWGTLALGAI